jgi:hypothetical protein
MSSFPTVAEDSGRGLCGRSPVLPSKPENRKGAAPRCNVKPIDDKKWEDITRRLLQLQRIFALGIGKENSHLTLRVDGKAELLTPEHFLWVIPTGSP